MRLVTSVLTLLFAVSAPSFATDNAADNYPNKPIRLIVPYTPGGGYDILARLLGQKLTERWGQQVVVDDRAGANGNIGAAAAAKSPPDGYTLLMGGIGPNAINASLYELSFDPVKDFAPVMLVATYQNILVVNPSLPVKSVKELIALAKSKPGQINYASAGSGSTQHLSAELFKTMAGIDLVHIPYKGSAPGMTALLSGEVSLMFNSTPTTLPYVKTGKLRGLTVTGSKRSPEAPELPTVAEAGVPGYEVIGWYGVLAPAGTPKEIVVKLNSELAKILQLPDIKERLKELGVEAGGGTPEQFGDYIKKEIAKWAKVVKESGARSD
ncbi:MAG TPA: tripartite tricarboxylate transporter substrate binding protein [Acidiferrobacterales bacterium]|nr:tripartite tricarboxylate transporter substrate binding protein [Acidiferrobacterales bacterium]